MKNGKLNVALVGLGFGGCFLPIYIDHPDVYAVGIFDIKRDLAEKFAELYPVNKIYDSFEEILEDDEVDAVHLVTPIPDHARQTMAVLNAGKHCASTVPMACSLEDVRGIEEAVERSGKKYMIMETTAYTYQMFHVKHMIETGELGTIQFMRGSHYQDMAGWPDYWLGLPPMWYGTHALSPLRILADSPITSVYCVGSGTMEEGLKKQYNNPFPVECAVFTFANGMRAEATRSLFETAHVYQEGLFVYGSKASFEWGFEDSSKPYVTHLKELVDTQMNELESFKRGKETPYGEIDVPNYFETLPRELWKHTVKSGDYDETNPQDSLKKGSGGGHHGSHPHLVHEFVRSIIEDRTPALDVKIGANIARACLLAHESALQGGVILTVEP